MIFSSSEDEGEYDSESNEEPFKQLPSKNFKQQKSIKSDNSGSLRSGQSLKISDVSYKPSALL